MDVEVLAQRLLAFSGEHDTDHHLVLRAGPRRDVYYRFSESRADPVRLLAWEARENAAGSERLPDQQARWLTRMDFRRYGGGGLLGRVVGMPHTIEDARVIAGLASFLLEHAYALPQSTAVSVALEAA